MNNMISKAILLSAASLLLLPVAACSTYQPDRGAADSLERTLAQPYFVNASQVVVGRTYKPLGNPRDVSATLPTPLDEAIRDYAQKRFQAAGQEGIFHYVIDDASVFHEVLPAGNGIGQFLGLGDQERYSVNVKVTLYRDGVAPSGIGAQRYELKSERSTTMNANVSLDERDARLRDLVRKVIGDIDRSATQGIGNDLKLSAPAPDKDIAPSPGPHPPVPVDRDQLN